MFRPFNTALMDINVPIPKDCSYKFTFSEDTKPHVLEKVSAFVNGVYSQSMGYTSTIKASDASIEVNLALRDSICLSIPPRCEFAFEYTEDNFKDRLDDAASFVSEIYSKFPTLSEGERKKLKDSQLCFHKREVNVTEEVIARFKIALKERIVKDIHNVLPTRLFVDNAPTGILNEVVQSVFQDCSVDSDDLKGLFPSKSHTWILLSKTTVSVIMKLGSTYH